MSRTTEEPTTQQLFNLSGRVALVTGGGGHLGGAMCRALAEAGASVVVSSRDESRAKATADGLPCVGDAKHHGVAIDHKDETSIQHGFATALKSAGQIDILVNNGHSGPLTDWTTVTQADFDDHLANATGYFLLARLMRDHAVERKAPASIILLGSMYGQVGSYPETYDGVRAASPVAYHALKGGIIHMTRHLAVYWAADGVRVNCLSPGAFPGPKVPGELVDRLCAKTPMKRMGLPWELKGSIVFLASKASSYMTGQNLVIDGGWTAW